MDISKERANVFPDWVKDAKAGDSVVYWIGSRVGGRHADIARKFSDSGHVHLVQRKLASFVFQYIAQRGKKVLK